MSIRRRQDVHENRQPPCPESSNAFRAGQQVPRALHRANQAALPTNNLIATENVTAKCLSPSQVAENVVNFVIARSPRRPRNLSWIESQGNRDASARGVPQNGKKVEFSPAYSGFK